MTFCVCKKINGKDIVICEVRTKRMAESLCKPWKEKGYFVKRRNKFAKRRKRKDVDNY